VLGFQPAATGTIEPTAIAATQPNAWASFRFVALRHARIQISGWSQLRHEPMLGSRLYFDHPTTFPPPGAQRSGG
jgi:hypothetical protein